MIPWRVTRVQIHTSVTSTYGQTSCEYMTDTTFYSWESTTGLLGNFTGSAKIFYECCSDGGYYFSPAGDCSMRTFALGGTMSIGADSLTISPGGCMEYQSCSSQIDLTLKFDRPMRLTWDVCYQDDYSGTYGGCPFADTKGYVESVEFPGAGIGPSGHVMTSYDFTFEGGAILHSSAENVRFERMYPADVVPNRTVDGSDISAILSKWGGPYDPQRTAADVNLDGKVDAEDLAAVLFAWGTPG